MCDNPLSPELKAALLKDNDRPLGLVARLGADQLRVALSGGGYVGAVSELSPASRLTQFHSTITTLVMNELSPKDVPHDRTLA